MVAIIKVSGSMHRIFNYNENKVMEGVAQCIGAENYPLEADEMSLNIRLNYLLKRMQLNQNVKRNSLHISLNFDPSEIGLPREKLMEIATAYMQKIGFGEQPFLAYQHHDAGHPHIHLVTTNIRADGSRIDLHHLAIHKSEPARKEIEKEFGLVAAQGRNERPAYQLEPIVMGRINYGKIQSKKALSNILRGVLETYKYTSLPELNAVLRQYNVLADRGTENSRIFNSGGLVYRILGLDGKPIGVPIKASDFYNKPTLNFLQAAFKANEPKRLPHKGRIKNTIDRILMSEKLTIEELVMLLEKQGIHAALRRNDAGLLYGITYVDHQTKCVFNGSNLGKQYSAKAIQERCLRKEVLGKDLTSHPSLERIGLESQDVPPATQIKVGTNDLATAALPAGAGNLLEMLMQSEQVSDYVPGELKKDKKRKKKRNLNNNQ